MLGGGARRRWVSPGRTRRFKVLRWVSPGCTREVQGPPLGFTWPSQGGSRSSAGFLRTVPGRFKVLRLGSLVPGGSRSSVWVVPGGSRSSVWVLLPREVQRPPRGGSRPSREVQGPPSWCRCPPGGSRSSTGLRRPSREVQGPPSGFAPGRFKVLRLGGMSREVQCPPSGLPREVQGPPSGFCCPGRFNVLRGVVRGRPGKFNVLRLGCVVPREAQGPPRGCAGRPGRFKVLRRGSRPGGSRSSVWVVCPGRFNVLRLGLAIPGRFNALLGLCLAVPGRFKVLLRGSAAPGGSRSSVGAAPVPAPGNGAVPFPAPGRSSPAPGLAVLAPGPSAPATSRPRWGPEKNGPADPLKPQRDRGRPGYLIGDLFVFRPRSTGGGEVEASRRPVWVYHLNLRQPHGQALARRN